MSVKGSGFCTSGRAPYHFRRVVPPPGVSLTSKYGTKLKLGESPSNWIQTIYFMMFISFHGQTLSKYEDNGNFLGKVWIRRCLIVTRYTAIVFIPNVFNLSRGIASRSRLEGSGRVKKLENGIFSIFQILNDICDYFNFTYHL